MGKEPSASQLLHDVLRTIPINKEFTMMHFRADAQYALGYIPTEGAVTGFLNRAVGHGNLEVVGRTKGRKKNVYVYKVVSHEPWLFKAAGIGSKPGRANKGGHQQELGMITATLEMEQQYQKLIEQTNKETLERMEFRSIRDLTEEALNKRINNLPSLEDDTVNMKVNDGDIISRDNKYNQIDYTKINLQKEFMDKWTVPEGTIEFINNEPKIIKISDKLLNMAIEINALESRPEKSLADFTTDELLAEIRLRLK